MYIFWIAEKHISKIGFLWFLFFTLDYSSKNFPLLAPLFEILEKISKLIRDLLEDTYRFNVTLLETYGLLDEFIRVHGDRNDLLLYGDFLILKPTGKSFCRILRIEKKTKDKKLVFILFNVFKKRKRTLIFCKETANQTDLTKSSWNMKFAI